MAKSRRIHLNLFLGDSGHHHAAWRRPGADTTATSTLEHYIAQAQTAEAAGIESVFVSDGLNAPRHPQYYIPRPFEPISLLSAIAARTRRIGLIGTMSTTFNEPYNVARMFSSLDHLSGGRSGWNIVTTAEDRSADNFGGWRGLDHAGRYRRAHEFVEVTKKLWDSWDEHAILADAAAGRYTDPSLIRAIGHRGEEFAVEGALNMPNCPQGRPVLVQAGSSPTGRDFAATHAEVVFTVQQTIAQAQDFYGSVKKLAAEHGRNPEQVKILPGVFFILGDTEAAARERLRELDELIVEAPALKLLNLRLGTSFGEQDLDRPLPTLPPTETHGGHQGRYQIILEMARRENLTIRQTMRRYVSGRGHHVVVGTPEQLADDLASWVTQSAADGFTLLPPTLPESLDLFVSQVVPLLKARGAMPEEYEGTTLRDHYCLGSPQR